MYLWNSWKWDGAQELMGKTGQLFYFVLQSVELDKAWLGWALDIVVAACINKTLADCCVLWWQLRENNYFHVNRAEPGRAWQSFTVQYKTDVWSLTPSDTPRC